MNYTWSGRTSYMNLAHTNAKQAIEEKEERKLTRKIHVLCAHCATTFKVKSHAIFEQHKARLF